jgi:hypothetical protein
MLENNMVARCLRTFQRNRSSWVCVCVCVWERERDGGGREGERERNEIHNTESVTSQDLLSARESGNPMMHIPLWTSAALRPTKSQSFHLNPKEIKKKKTMLQFKADWQEFPVLMFDWGFQWIIRSLPLRRSICFTQPISPSVNPF